MLRIVCVRSYLIISLLYLDELRKKGPYINGFLETALGEHVLLPTTAAQGIIFDPKYIKMVMKYHENLERPDGTFDVVNTEAVAKEKAIERKLKLQELSELPRDVCESCMCRKQVYCGDCTGVRMKNAEDFLPKRINLPFNVLLLIDWYVRYFIFSCQYFHLDIRLSAHTSRIIIATY